MAEQPCAAHRRVELSGRQAEIPFFPRRALCSKCGGKGVEVRPNFNEQPQAESLIGKQWL
jgi:hypothetical protein